jgi:hypothetical protein
MTTTKLRWPIDIDSWIEAPGWDLDHPRFQERSLVDVCTVNESGPNLWRWALLLAVIIAAGLAGDLCRGAEGQPTLAKPNETPAQQVIELGAGNVRGPLGGYVLGRASVISGEGHGGQTVLRRPRGDTAPAITSADLATWKASGKGQWAFEGVPTGVFVRDLTVDGQSGVNPQSVKYDKRPRGPALIELYSPGADVERVKVFDYAGVALTVGHGTADMHGPSDVTESGVIRIARFRTDRTHAGVWVTSTADGLADDLELMNPRDFGARFDGAAWEISRVHAAGANAKPTPDDPDAGCGIINGPFANYYGWGIQPDNCRVGFRNYGPGTSVEQLIGKLCCETTVHAVKKLRIARLSIETPGGRRWMEHFNAAPRGVVIEPTAAGSIIGDEFSECSTGEATAAVMFDVRASRSEIRTARSSWGGLVSGNTCVEYGSPTQKLWGSRIDVWASGYGTGVKLTHLIGRGNTIVVHHNGNCAVPIEVGPNTNLAGNDVRIENASEWGGTWTVLARKDDVTTGAGK